MVNSPTNPFWLRYVPASFRLRIEHQPDLLQVVNNIAWLSGDKILRIGVGLFISVWVARYLGPEDFGLLSFAIAFVSLFGAIATLGLPGIVVRDIVSDQKSHLETLGSSFVLQVIGGITAFVLLFILIAVFRPHDPFAINVVVILGLTLLLKGSESIKCWYESQVQSKYTVWVEAAVFLVIAAMKTALILTGASLLAFVWVTCFEGLATAVLLFAMYVGMGGRLKTWRFNFTRAKTLLKHSWPLMFSGLAVMLYMRIDQIMLGQMLNDEAVGIYTVAIRISEVWYFIPMAIVGSVFPAILEAKKTSEALYLDKFQKLYDLLVIIALVVAIPVTFLSNQIIEILFGQEYIAAGTILSIHIWTALFVFLGVASGKWFLAENRQLLAFQRVFLGMCVNIVLNFVLIPRHGGAGAAMATLISQAVAALLIDVIHKDTRLMFRMKLKACLLTRAFRVQYSA